MTLQQFVDKYNGKFCEVGGSAGAVNQCVDLANAYIKEVLGQPILLGTNAVDFPERIGDKYDFILNATDNFPIAGDIIIFKQYGTRYGSAGHIAVVISADINLVTMFEENYPTGSVCKTNSRNYLGCRGWLRLKDIFYKGYDLTNVPAESLKVMIDAVTDLQKGELVRKVEVENLQKQIDSLKTSQEDLAKIVEELRLSIGEKEKTLGSITKELGVLKAEKETWSAQLEYYKPYKSRYETALLTQVDKYSGSQLLSMGWKKIWSARKLLKTS